MPCYGSGCAITPPNTCRGFRRACAALRHDEYSVVNKKGASTVDAGGAAARELQDWVGGGSAEASEAIGDDFWGYLIDICGLQPGDAMYSWAE
jgi:hypothetical protein